MKKATLIISALFIFASCFFAPDDDENKNENQVEENLNQ